MKLSQAQLACLKTLENSHGQITAKRVLAEARRPKSPLHSLPVFKNWNVKYATEKWWLHCCQLVIGAVELQVVNQETIIKTSGYIVDPTMKDGGYRSVVAMSRDKTSAREALIETLKTASGHLRRALDLAQPLGLANEIDRLLAQIAGVARLVQKKAA